MSSRRRVRRRQQGDGLFDVLKGVNSFLKRTGIISKGAKALGGILPGSYGNIAGTVGNVAGSLGYGRRRRRAPRRGGALVRF